VTVARVHDGGSAGSADSAGSAPKPPADERKDLYYTPESKREERCNLLGR